MGCACLGRTEDRKNVYFKPYQCIRSSTARNISKTSHVNQIVCQQEKTRKESYVMVMAVGEKVDIKYVW